MGVKERKERDRQEMRETILKSAHQLFVDKGFEDVSIRNIAEAVEYSPATIYLYFKDKDEIFYAIHQEAFKFFNDYVADLLKIKDAFKRLIKMGERYIQFSKEYPKYYTIMFLTESPMHNYDDSEKWQEGCKTHEFLEATIAQCIQEGHFKGYDHRALAFTIWSYVHGMCSLSLRGRMKIYEEAEQAKMIDKSFKMFKQILEGL
jgi:AcrR family transcriptional regulator